MLFGWHPWCLQVQRWSQLWAPLAKASILFLNPSCFALCVTIVVVVMILAANVDPCKLML